MLSMGLRLHRPYQADLEYKTDSYIDITQELVMEFVNINEKLFLDFLNKKINARTTKTDWWSDR